MKNLQFKTLFLLIFFFFPIKTYSKYALLSSDYFNNLVLKLAENENEKEKGLMNIEELVDVNGMLFLYKKPKVVKMWMHNTKIPLDIIFIDESKKVISINYGEPFSKKIISSKNKVIAVLEIPYQCAKKLKIREGSQVNWLNIDKNKKGNIRYYHCLAN